MREDVVAIAVALGYLARKLDDEQLESYSHVMVIISNSCLLPFRKAPTKSD